MHTAVHIPGRQVCKSTQCFSDRKGRSFSMGSCSGFGAMWATGPRAESVSLPKAEPFNGGDTRAQSCCYLQPREGFRSGRGGSSCPAATSGSPSREHGPPPVPRVLCPTHPEWRTGDTKGASLPRGLGHHGCLAQGHPAWRREFTRHLKRERFSRWLVIKNIKDFFLKLTVPSPEGLRTGANHEAH